MGNTALKLACNYGNADCVDLLIKAGADVNLFAYGSAVTTIMNPAVEPRPKSGETALMKAVKTSKPECVSLLLTAGADVNIRESARGQTALL